MIKIFIDKSIQMTDEDTERVKDFSLQSERITMHSGHEGIMQTKEDDKGNIYILGFIIQEKK